MTFSSRSLFLYHSLFLLPSLLTTTVRSSSTGPCDIFDAGNTPCVAAHSLTRALYGTYNGALYQVRRVTDNATKDITVLVPGGYADTTVQDVFCGINSCVVQMIYDQVRTRRYGARRRKRLRLSLHDGSPSFTHSHAIYIRTGSGYHNNVFLFL
jgi:hypothetical protein